MQKNIDKDLIEKRFYKSRETYNSNAVIQANMADTLINELKSCYPDKLSSVLELGCGTGLLTQKLLKTYEIDELISNDIVDNFRDLISDITNQYTNMLTTFINGDIEKINSFPNNLDLVISGAAFQWLINIDIFLRNIRKNIKPNGIIAFTSFGPKNFHEIKTVEKYGLEYLPFDKLRTIISKYYKIIFAKNETITLKFKTPIDVLKHLKLTGVNSLRNQKWTKTNLLNFEHNYLENFSTDDGVNLTYNPYYFIAKKL